MHLESSLRWKIALPLQLSSLSCRIEQVAILTAETPVKTKDLLTIVSSSRCYCIGNQGFSQRF
jgi:hypothetical protein